MARNVGNLEGFVDAIADSVLGKLTGRPNQGPTGEPMPQLPDLPWGRKDVPPLAFHPRLRVQGLEVTQSTQYYGTGYGPDNSVPIVALKPLVVRAYPYVSAGLFEGDTLSGKTVTGELVLFRWGKEVFRIGPTRPAGARVGPESRLDRDLWDKENTIYTASGKLGVELVSIAWNPTLNFRVPAWYLRAGQTTAVVRLWLTSGEGGTATASESFQVIPVNAPKLALVRVNWENTANNTVTSPSDSDLLGLCALAARMLPFPYLETTILGVELTKSGDFSGPPLNADGSPNPGGCNAAWVDLLTELKVTRLFAALFNLADIVYGVVPQAGALTVMGTRNTGCGWGDDGVGGCLVGDEIAFAHEVGHLYGCGHVGDQSLASYDASYPNYGGSKTSIGEVGIDTALGATPLSEPGRVNDLMSYKQPQWVSPYTYLKILNNRDNHMSAAADPRKVRPLLIVAFRVDRMADGSRKIDKIKAHVVQGPGIVPPPRGSAPGNWFIELVDGNDRIIASHACRTPAMLGGGCRCCDGVADIERAPRLDFVEALEWSEEVTRIQINRGDSQIASLDVGQAPSVEISGPEWQEGSLILHVRVHHPRSRASLVILFTGDNGKTWSPVAIDPAQNDPLVVDALSLPGGESCRFRAVATAEFRAASADSDSFS
ncbi:MAG: hypothetical protein HXY51_14255, partial [Nitrospirae bacterium]|nr:hypothetical protein [Nitrospirota bacterium]